MSATSPAVAEAPSRYEGIGADANLLPLLTGLPPRGLGWWLLGRDSRVANDLPGQQRPVRNPAAKSLGVVVSGCGESKRPRDDGVLGALPVSQGMVSA
jgi:hypothetical protein